MRNKLTIIVVCLFLYAASLSAQDGFNIEVGIGPTLGNSSELYKFTLQGTMYYFKEIKANVNIGAAIGALLFLGDNSHSEDMYIGFYPNEYEPQLYLPFALASRVQLSQKFTIGLDTGYAHYIHLYSGGGGFYYRPIILFKLKEKLALICSYGSIIEYGYNLSTINIGINIAL